MLTSPLIPSSPIVRDERAPALAPRLLLVLAVFDVSFVQTWMVAQWLLLNTVWIAPGVILATCYRLRGRACLETLILMALADIGGATLAGQSLSEATLLMLIHASGAVAGGMVLRRLQPDGLDLGRSRSTFALFLVAVVVAPPVGVAVNLLIDRFVPQLADQAHYLVLLPGSRMLGEMVARRLLTPVLGIVLATPLALAMLGDTPIAWRKLLTRRRLIDHGVVALVTVGVFFSRGASYTAFLPAALVWIGVRQGIRDVGAATLVSLLIASCAVAMGDGPVDVLNSAPHVRQLFLEVTYLCCYAWILPVAVALESRERLEKDLARSLESSRQILSNLNEVVFRLDRKNRWSYLNPAWEALTGYGVAETIGRSALELIATEDLAPTVELITAFSEGKLPEIRMQRRMRRRDGEMREFEIQVRAVHDGDGRFDGALGSMRDITDQARYMMALQESEQRFRLLCDTSPVGIIRFDRAGAVTYLNVRCELFVMRPSSTLVGQSWGNAFGTANCAVWDELIRVLLTPGAVFERELEITDQYGLRRWLALSMTGEFDPATHCVGYIAAVTDVTEARKSAVELAARTSELRLITENISDVVYRIGLDGTHLYATPSVREVLGHSPAAVVGRRMGDRIHADDRARVQEAFQSLVRGEKDQISIAFREFPSDPSRDMIWLEANSRLLRDRKGQPQEIVSALRDVTHSKTLELELLEAGSRAEAAVRAKSQFLANLSHEIRTPMNGVIGLADLLLGHELDPVSRRYVETIAQSGQTMMALLNDILDMAKIDAGRLHVSHEAFDLRECLDGSLRLMTASALGKGLDLQQDFAANLPQRIVGDSLRLRQVLANLIGNAVKFTSNGFVRLGARRDGDRLVITVADTGIGIASDQQSRLFEEFVQADVTVAGLYGGSGLGLCISRRLAEAMGGQLSLQSEAGRGTILTLTLPVCECASEAAPAKAVVSAVTPVTGQGFHLLVAEDNHTNQIIMQAMLQRLGHQVEVAGCGEDVLEKVEQAQSAGHPFDGVLMDIQMPGMDGLVATRRLRELGHDAAHLPVIAVTANGYAEDIDECLRAGMQGHLVKPVRVHTLADELERMIVRRAAA